MYDSMSWIHSVVVLHSLTRCYILSDKDTRGESVVTVNFIRYEVCIEKVNVPCGPNQTDVVTLMNEGTNHRGSQKVFMSLCRAKHVVKASTPAKHLFKIGQQFDPGGLLSCQIKEVFILFNEFCLDLLRPIRPRIDPVYYPGNS